MNLPARADTNTKPAKMPNEDPSTIPSMVDPVMAPTGAGGELTVFANGRSIIHRGSGTYNQVFADTCMTPKGGGCTPVPYINEGHSRDTVRGPRSVFVCGEMVMAKDAEYAKTSGDEPGTVGGLLSGTHRDVAQLASYSFDVKFEGRGVGREGDHLFHNRRNAYG